MASLDKWEYTKYLSNTNLVFNCLYIHYNASYECFNIVELKTNSFYNQVSNLLKEVRIAYFYYIFLIIIIESY